MRAGWVHDEGGVSYDVGGDVRNKAMMRGGARVHVSGGWACWVLALWAAASGRLKVMGGRVYLHAFRGGLHGVIIRFISQSGGG
jgi:hypothetical protein